MILGDIINVKRARKPHVCWWCGEGIPIGDPYVRWVWVDDKPLSVKVHPECRDAWSTLDDDETEVLCAEFSRGCTCQRGDCKCSALDGGGK